MSQSVCVVDEPLATTEESIELTVVMPCLNEERTLPICIGKALRTMDELGICGEVLVVDNGSTDSSIETARSAGARVVRQSLRGYGNALRRGCEAARGRYIIMGDCDDSYDFTDLKRFVDRLRAGADLVMGNRFAGEIKPAAMPWLHQWFGNPFLSWFLNLLFRTRARDSFCGMRGFTRNAFERMHLQMPGMEFALEMVIKSAHAGMRVEEIPITLWPDGRDRPPHLRSFRDGWRGMRFMLMCSPTFLFVIPGLLMTVAGLASIPTVVLAGYGLSTNKFGPPFMYTASIVSIIGAHLLVFGLLAKLHAHLVDPVFEDPRLDRMLSWFTVERGLLAGLFLMLLAAVSGVPVFVYWLQTRAVPVPGQWIFAGTVFFLGLEAFFASFLVGILDLRRESGRTG